MKKKRKITGQQIKFIINMLGLAIFAFSYLYIYQGYVDKKDAAYDQIEEVKQEIKQKEDKISTEDSVRKNTEELKSQIQQIIDSYPVDITKVDNLLFVEQLEKDLNIRFNTVNPTDSTAIFGTILPIRNADGTEVVQVPSADANQGTVTPTASEDAQSDSGTLGDKSQNKQLDNVEAEIGQAASSNAASNQAAAGKENITTMTGLESTITMNFQTTYEGFKQLVDYINHYPDKTVIDSVSVSRDSSTNELTGSLVLKRYALAGTGKVYETPTIDDISIGTDNIFGTDSAVTPTPTQVPSDAEEQAGTTPVTP